MPDNLKLFDVTGKILLGFGAVCTLYGLVASNSGEFVMGGLLVVGLAIFWSNRIKGLKSEIETLSVMGDEFASALSDGRDLQSAIARGTAKLGQLKFELPKDDFRDPEELVQISYSEFITTEQKLQQGQQDSDKKTASHRKVESDTEMPILQQTSFTYLEENSSLYGPDGCFLKQVYCPKALHWNQLLADDSLGRSRGCTYCSKKVINLDVMDPLEVVEILRKDPKQCVFGTNKSVRFLHDQNRPPSPTLSKSAEPVVIHTVRTVLDINRAACIGYWPDVRLVTYETGMLGTPLSIIQNTKTGVVEVEIDTRFGQRDPNKWKQVVDLENHYQYHQNMPIAAYLVPKKLPAGSLVMVHDPIEDILGSVEGPETFRAKNVKGVWNGEKIILDPAGVKVRYALG